MEIGTRVLVAHPVMAFGVVLRSSGGVEDNSETVHASRFHGPTTCGETASESVYCSVLSRERLTSSTRELVSAFQIAFVNVKSTARIADHLRAQFISEVPSFPPPTWRDRRHQRPTFRPPHFLDRFLDVTSALLI